MGGQGGVEQGTYVASRGRDSPALDLGSEHHIEKAFSKRGNLGKKRGYMGIFGLGVVWNGMYKSEGELADGWAGAALRGFPGSRKKKLDARMIRPPCWEDNLAMGGLRM